MINNLLVAVSCAGLWSAQVVAEDESLIQDVLEGYSTALAMEDAQAAEVWVMAESDEFSIFEGSGSDIGWTSYRDHHLVPEFASESFSISVYDWRGYSIESDGNLAVATFVIRMEYENDGVPRERDAHGTAILRRTENGWRIRHIHTS